MLLPVASQYAICGIVRLAVSSQEGYCQIDDLVEGTTAPEHAVRKTFQQLAKHRVLRSVRGIRGGFRLAKQPDEITLMQIVEAVDGPFPATPWGDNHFWEVGETCPLARAMQPMWEQLTAYLRNTRISDLIAIAGDPSTVPANQCTANGGSLAR